MKCAFTTSKRHIRTFAICARHHAISGSELMPDKNAAATHLCDLRSAPPANGIIRFLSALILVAPIVLGPAHFASAISLLETPITANDAAAGDQFGFAVSVSGNTVIVGAPFDDDAGLS